MLKNFINLTQEEIMKLESRIEKLDKDAEEYKQIQRLIYLIKQMNKKNI